MTNNDPQIRTKLYRFIVFYVIIRLIDVFNNGRVDAIVKSRKNCNSVVNKGIDEGKKDATVAAASVPIIWTLARCFRIPRMPQVENFYYNTESCEFSKNRNDNYRLHKNSSKFFPQLTFHIPVFMVYVIFRKDDSVFNEISIYLFRNYGS